MVRYAFLAANYLVTNWLFRILLLQHVSCELIHNQQEKLISHNDIKDFNDIEPRIVGNRRQLGHNSLRELLEFNSIDNSQDENESIDSDSKDYESQDVPKQSSGQFEKKTQRHSGMNGSQEVGNERTIEPIDKQLLDAWNSLRLKNTATNNEEEEGNSDKTDDSTRGRNKSDSLLMSSKGDSEDSSDENDEDSSDIMKNQELQKDNELSGEKSGKQDSSTNDPFDTVDEQNSEDADEKSSSLSSDIWHVFHDKVDNDSIGRVRASEDPWEIFIPKSKKEKANKPDDLTKPRKGSFGFEDVKSLIDPEGDRQDPPIIPQPGIDQKNDKNNEQNSRDSTKSTNNLPHGSPLDLNRTNDENNEQKSSNTTHGPPQGPNKKEDEQEWKDGPNTRGGKSEFDESKRDNEDVTSTASSESTDSQREEKEKKKNMRTVGKADEDGIFLGENQVSNSDDSKNSTGMSSLMWLIGAIVIVAITVIAIIALVIYWRRPLDSDDEECESTINRQRDFDEAFARNGNINLPSASIQQFRSNTSWPPDRTGPFIDNQLPYQNNGQININVQESFSESSKGTSTAGSDRAPSTNDHILNSSFLKNPCPSTDGTHDRAGYPFEMQNNYNTNDIILDSSSLHGGLDQYKGTGQDFNPFDKPTGYLSGMNITPQYYQGPTIGDTDANNSSVNQINSFNTSPGLAFVDHGQPHEYVNVNSSGNLSNTNSSTLNLQTEVENFRLQESVNVLTDEQEEFDDRKYEAKLAEKEVTL